MFKITILAVGALKEPYWKDAVAEYAKRLSPYAKVRIVEADESRFTEAADAPRVMAEEAARLRKHIPKDAYAIALDKGGKEMATEDFTEFLRREGEGGRELAFVIGGSLGLSPALADECSAKLSLSKMTFTHGEARVLLFEQVYRAMTIMARKTYHY